MKWRVTCNIGVYWDGPEYLIGFYRWEWQAYYAAKFHLFWNPYRECTIVKVSIFDRDWAL